MISRWFELTVVDAAGVGEMDARRVKGFISTSMFLSLHFLSKDSWCFGGFAFSSFTRERRTDSTSTTSTLGMNKYGEKAQICVRSLDECLEL